MSRNISATLQGTTTYDDCLITSCLKKMFTKAPKSAAQSAFVIRNHIAEFKKELEQLHNDGVLETSYPYLEAMERSLPEADFRYVVIYKKNVPVLFGYFQLFTLTSENFDLGKNKRFIKGIVRFFLNLKRAIVLISGNALRTETAWYCYNETALHKEEAIEVIAAAAEKIADDEDATALILKDMPGTPYTRKWLASMGYEMPLQDMTMVVDIDKKWGTLAGYTEALTRKYKTRANKILTSANKLELKELTQKEVVEHEADISRLFKNVADKQSFVLTNVGQDHFSLLKKVYKDNFEVFGFFDEGKLVAFYSAFVTDDAYEVYYIGFDYASNAEFQLYFNILFSSLERAIVLKKKQLKLGRTSFDAKASIGAKPVEMNYFIKIANVPSIVSNWFANYFSSMEDAKWKLRNPLK